MSPVGYPYASGDLLENPHTYFYSEYAGRPFLDAWREQRERLLKDLPDALDPPAGKDDPRVLEGDVIGTDGLLDHLFAAARDGRMEDAGVRDRLSRLVKKFEVSKRIHRAYGPSFRAVERADHKDPARYLRLAEVFEAAYAAAGELPYMNVLLKCMDTLCTLAEQLSEDERGRLARLIEGEREHVGALAKAVKVNA